MQTVERTKTRTETQNKKYTNIYPLKRNGHEEYYKIYTYINFNNLMFKIVFLIYFYSQRKISSHQR